MLANALRFSLQVPEVSDPMKFTRNISELKELSTCIQKKDVLLRLCPFASF